jgi:hypothetical protein
MYGIEAVYTEYNDIVGEFGKNKIQDRYESLLKTTHAFIEKFDYNQKVRVNEITLLYTVFDYFSDISRLKSFHNIDKINEVKILSYEIFWLLRRKPLQQLVNDPDIVYVNEQFVFTKFFHFLMGNKDSISLQDNRELDFFADSLFYFLKYRHCDAQMFELLLLSFKAGEIYRRIH